MNLKLSRRQFGQLVLVSTTATALGVLIEKTIAQTPNSVIWGISSNIKTTDSSTNVVSDNTDDSDEAQSGTTSASPVQSITIQAFDIASKQVRNVLTTPAILSASERVTSLVSLNGSPVISVTTSRGREQSSRLVLLGTSPRSIDIPGLNARDRVRSLTRLQDGSIVAVIGSQSGTGTSRISKINTDRLGTTQRDNTTNSTDNSTPNTEVRRKPTAGGVIDRVVDKGDLPTSLVIRNIAECADGKLYGINTARSGETSLYLFDTEKQIPLTFQGQPWISGFSGLVCSSGVLYALGARRYESPKYLHSINKDTGELTRLQAFDVVTIAIS
jgi:hypothetical protein